MNNFVESEQEMQWRAEKLYIPAAKKPFKTYPGVGEKPPDKCSEPAQGQIGGRERQLLFSSLPDESNSPPPAPMPAPPTRGHCRVHATAPCPRLESASASRNAFAAA